MIAGRDSIIATVEEVVENSSVFRYCYRVQSYRKCLNPIIIYIALENRKASGMADDERIRFEKIGKLQKNLRFQPLRFVLIFFTLVLTLYGAGLLVATLTVRSELSGYKLFLYYYLDKPVLILFIGSVVLIAISCLGIISSAQNLYQGIITFGVLLFGLFMFIFTMGAVSLVITSSADQSIINALEIHIKNYTEYNDPMDYVQKNLECCGISDFTDWNLTLGYIPGSCCGSDSACGFSDVINMSETGCYEALQALVQFVVKYLIILLGVLAALQITGMILAFFLARGMADIRRKISPIRTAPRNAEGELPAPSAPEITKLENPLALKGILRRPSQVTPSLLQDYSSPSPENKLDNPGAYPAPTPARGIYPVRQPVPYRDMPFSYGPSAPPLTRPHRKFPIGF